MPAHDTRDKPRRNRLLWTVFRLVRAVLIAYLLVLLVLMWFEEYLVFPAPKYPAGDWNPASLVYEDIYFTSSDGTKLHGWYVEHPDPKGYLLFCHGNGEHVANLAGILQDCRDVFQMSAFAFDYRGYGRSEGSPYEEGVLADGHAAQKWLAERAGIGLDEIIIMGRSIGGAIAVDLAAENGARALVLERTFSSLPEVAALHYPLFPVRLLMRTRFDSASKIGRYDGPLLQSHGTADEVVPFELGEKLFAAAASKDKYFIPEEGHGHSDPYTSEYWNRLQQFLAELPP